MRWVTEWLLFILFSLFFSHTHTHTHTISLAWWCTPLIPGLRRQRQADSWVRVQPGLQSEFQDSQGYTEKHCLKKTKTKNKQTNKTILCNFTTYKNNMNIYLGIIINFKYQSYTLEKFLMSLCTYIQFLCESYVKVQYFRFFFLPHSSNSLI